MGYKGVLLRDLLGISRVTTKERTQYCVFVDAIVECAYDCAKCKKELEGERVMVTRRPKQSKKHSR